MKFKVRNLKQIAQTGVAFALLFVSTVGVGHEMMSWEEQKKKLVELSARESGTGKINAHDEEFRDLFKPMDDLFPNATRYRDANGLPGSEYWENRADYRIEIELNEKTNRIQGEVQITFHNNSPQTLPFLWLQLDQQGLDPGQAFANGNILDNVEPRRDNDENGNAVLNLDSYKLLLQKEKFGFDIRSVKGSGGKDLEHFVQGTLMRVDLTKPLKPKSSVTFVIEYGYLVPDVTLRLHRLARTGFEQSSDGGKSFYIMQFYPRMAYYDEDGGWDIQPYYGQGEFNLAFGDFELFLTVPDNHVLTATGELQNPSKVLPAKQLKRLNKARSSEKPVAVITKSEAVAAAKTKAKGNKTWHFVAENVRDVAFASSSRFLWDSMRGSSGPEEKRKILVNSFYHAEADSLPSKMSLAAVQHAIDTYAGFTFDYPYPVLNLVEGAKMAMEYPMLATYNFAQEEDGTYSIDSKVNALTTIFHEVGHNFIPMTVSTNERKWGWMDEGMTTFLHNESASSWSNMMSAIAFNLAKEGTIHFMKRGDRSPIMNQPDNMRMDDFGPAAYTMPAFGLALLRESVLGREVFDKAFKEFFKAWKFKHPTPHDFFRHMEKASGRELNWFWRGWFYSTGHVDMAIEEVRVFNISELDGNETQESLAEIINDESSAYNQYVATIRDKDRKKVVEKNPELGDLLDEMINDPSKKKTFETLQLQVSREALGEENFKYLKAGKKFIQIRLSNRGGIIMPVFLRITFEDGTFRNENFSANVWRKSKATSADLVIMLPKEKMVSKVTLDPHFQTADARRINNYWGKGDFQSGENIFLENFNRPPQVNMMQFFQSLEGKK